jgi:hypothetical protein
MRIVRVSHFHQPTSEDCLFNGYRVVQLFTGCDTTPTLQTAGAKRPTEEAELLGCSELSILEHTTIRPVNKSWHQLNLP